MNQFIFRWKENRFMTSKSRRKDFVQFFQDFAIFLCACAVRQYVHVIYEFNWFCLFFVTRIYLVDSHWKINIIWVKQRISAKFLRLSCLSHLFFFSKVIEDRRSFKKLLTYWIIQFDIFLFFKLCSNLTYDTWSYVFATFTFMILIIFSLSCFLIACISFDSIFNLVSISCFSRALICNSDNNRFFFVSSVILLVIIDFNILLIVFSRAIDL